MEHRCLIIADDFTGAADTGAQFAKNGLITVLVSPLNCGDVDLSLYGEVDALVINTQSREIEAEASFSRISSLLEQYNPELFPTIYKKIDSTLRGNLGKETDAVLKKTGFLLGIVAPAFPEQRRVVAGGILLVDGKPVGLTEAGNRAFDKKESYIRDIFQTQGMHSIGTIALPYTAAGKEELVKELKRLKSKGKRLVVLDSYHRADLKNIVEAAFCLKEKPVFIGSAGMAQEVSAVLSKISSKSKKNNMSSCYRKYKRVLIVVGSQSCITKNQIARIACSGSVNIVELDPDIIGGDKSAQRLKMRSLTGELALSLKDGHTLFKTCSKSINSKIEVAKALGEISMLALEASGLEKDQTALAVTGGETAGGLMDALKAKKIAISGELSPGVVRGSILEGKWKGLEIVSKAGAFGADDALEKIIACLGESADTG